MHRRLSCFRDLICFCHAGILLATCVLLNSSFALAQSPPIRMCTETPTPPWCSAVRGDRAEGWVPQTRSEVMARNGMVTTVQPLAAMAGARILMQGGNAIDAAVATAATLNVTFPPNVGIAGDLFAIIYIAKENKLYQLNASGIAPSGLSLARMNSLGYNWNPANFAPGSGIASRWDPHRHGARVPLGLGGGASPVRDNDLQGSFGSCY